MRNVWICNEAIVSPKPHYPFGFEEYENPAPSGESKKKLFLHAEYRDN
jgi:hypothetical protein